MLTLYSLLLVLCDFYYLGLLIYDGVDIDRYLWETVLVCIFSYLCVQFSIPSKNGSFVNFDVPNFGPQIPVLSLLPLVICYWYSPYSYEAPFDSTEL